MQMIFLYLIWVLNWYSQQGISEPWGLDSGGCSRIIIKVDRGGYDRYCWSQYEAEPLSHVGSMQGFSVWQGWETGRIWWRSWLSLRRHHFHMKYTLWYVYIYNIIIVWHRTRDGRQNGSDCDNCGGWGIIMRWII